MPELTDPGLAALEAESVPAERRSEPRRRRGCPCAVRLMTRPDFQVYPALLHDLAPWGIGLLAEQPFAEEAVLIVLLQRRDANVSGVLTAQVRHATPLPDGAWRVGCRLVRPLAAKELLALL